MAKLVATSRDPEEETSATDWVCRPVKTIKDMDKINIAATMTVDGDVYDSVGVRFKGQTSYFMITNEDKKSFAIAVDFTPPLNHC